MYMYYTERLTNQGTLKLLTADIGFLNFWFSFLSLSISSWNFYMHNKAQILMYIREYNIKSPLLKRVSYFNMVNQKWAFQVEQH